MKHRNTFHVFHLIMCFLTGFLWSIIWLACAVSNARYNEKLDRQAQQKYYEHLEAILKSRGY